jgi:glycosyltransferase involved in cell wall biosynthesis
MSKSITIINQDSGYLMIDIANAFEEAGYEVSLVAGRLVERNTPLHPSIKLDKICRYRRSSILARLHSWCWGMIQIIFKVWLKYPKSHLFIVSNPPFAPLIPLICKNSFSLLIYDVYIEKPAEFPVIRKLSFLTSLWKKAHKKVFRKAEKIFTISKGMQKSIEKYSGGKTVDVVPIWTDNIFFKPIPPGKNPFISKHDLNGKFIVMYSGNIGTSSGLESLIDVASLVKDEKVLFLIIGDGIRKNFIKEKINKLQIDNCKLLPWQEPRDLPYSMASANLAVVSLSAQSSKSAIPSKIFNYMSVGAPVLSLAEQDSDLSELVRSRSIGKSFNPSNIEETAKYITSLANDPDECEQLSANSILASKDFTSENAKKFLV